MSIQSVNINFHLLKIYTYYRAILGCVLLATFYTGLAPNILGNEYPTLFIGTSIIYTLANLLTLFALWGNSFNPQPERLFAILFIDAVAIVLLVHSSGGLDSGLGFLLLIGCAAGGIFLSTQLSIVLAAMTSLIFIAETIYNINRGIGDSRALFSSGILGILLFFVSITFNYLSKKLRQSYAEANQQAKHAKHLEKIAQMIIERMQTGVLVCSPNGAIEVINQSAKQFLSWPESNHYNLDNAPELTQQLKQWRTHSVPQTNNTGSESLKDVRVSFANLNLENDSQTIIFLEDNRALTKEAQQLKLASLGRLTASIAHEIRNPLGAISHAGQLLSESDNLSSADKRLTEIIDTHSKRVNQIIENIMQLSRGHSIRPEHISLNRWLPKFAQDYRYNNDQEADIEVTLPETEVTIKFDLSQLRQIMNNLVDNGLRHGFKRTGKLHIQINVDFDEFTGLPQLSVIDDGDGIDKDKVAEVFEPFTTTEALGSGLDSTYRRLYAKPIMLALNTRENPV